MPIISSCCCWWERPDSLKRGSYASFIYTTIVGVIQLILAGYGIFSTIRIEYSSDKTIRWKANEIENYFPPGAFALIYLSVGFVIAKLVVGVMLWIGIERGKYLSSRNYIIAWLAVNASFQFYIFISVIYVCGFLQHYRLYDIYFMDRQLVLGIWFGVLDMGVMIAAIICVAAFFQQMERYEFSAKRKTRRALWNFDLGMSIRGGSTTMSRAPSTSYSFESLAGAAEKRGFAVEGYGVSSSAV